MRRRRMGLGALGLAALVALMALVFFGRERAPLAPALVSPNVPAAPPRTPTQADARSEASAAQDAPMYQSDTKPKPRADARHGALSGWVRDRRSRAPIADAELTFMREGVAHVVSSAADGGFAFGAPAPGRYTLVELTARGYVPYSEDASGTRLSFVAAPGSRVAGAVLTLAPIDSAPAPPSDDAAAVGTVRGTVVDEARRPVADAEVTLYYGAQRAGVVQSGSDGAFVHPVSRTGVKLYVSASRRGYAPTRPMEVALGRADVTLVLKRGASLVGRVLADGRPVPVFTVAVAGRAETFLDAAGTFEIAGISEGAHEVRAYALGFAPSAPLSLSFPNGSAVEVTLELEQQGRISGRVIDEATRQPVVGARVSTESRWLSGASPAEVGAEVLTDAGGNFVIGGMGPGLRSITVSAEGYHERIASGFAVEPDGDVGPVEIGLSKVVAGEGQGRELVGIGAGVEMTPEGIRLGQVFLTGPAERGGLRKGDVITRINGAATADMSLESAIERLRGVEGSTVVVTIERGGKSTEHTLTRSRIRVPH